MYNLNCKLSEQHINILNRAISNVNILGRETPVYMELVEILNTSITKEDTVEEKDKQ